MRFIAIIGGLVVTALLVLGVKWLIDNVNVKRQNRRKK